jgi:hypothetical protein
MILKATYGVKILTARTYIDFNSTTDCQTLVFLEHIFPDKLWDIVPWQLINQSNWWLITCLRASSVGVFPVLEQSPTVQLDIIYELSLLDLHRLFLIYCNVKWNFGIAKKYN